MSTDLSTTTIGRNLRMIKAQTSRGKAFLRMQVDPDDAPTVDHDGKTFIIITQEQFSDLKQEAMLAGLNLME